MALDFFAGCLGGAAGVIVGHPLDTVKVRLQTQSPTNLKYRGTFHCLTTIVKQESVSGLYKGISSPLFGVAGVNALIFGVYGALQPYVSGSPGNNTLWAHFAAGSISGAVQSVIASPMELVKLRLQVNEDLPGVRKQGPIDVLKGIYRNEGGLFRGVFKGWGITLAREIPGFGFYFASYEAFTRLGDGEVGTLGMLMAGGMAGVVSWTTTYGIDVVKTRIQCDDSGKYKGVLDCARKTYVAEGHRAFTRGLVSTLIRAFPTNAATFTVVTWVMRLAEGAPEDDVQSSKQYMDELLNKTSQLHEKLEDSLRLNVPQYLFCGNSLTSCSLASQCAASAQKYASRTQVYFNFYQSLQQQIQEEEQHPYQSQLASVETESGEKLGAFLNDQDKGRKGSLINTQGQENNLIFMSSSSGGSISTRSIPVVQAAEEEEKECEEKEEDGKNDYNRMAPSAVHQNAHIHIPSTSSEPRISGESSIEIENRSSERENGSNANPVNNAISSVQDNTRCGRDNEDNNAAAFFNNSSSMVHGNRGKFSHGATSFPAAASSETTGVVEDYADADGDDGERNVALSLGGLNYLSKSLDIPVHIVEAAVVQQTHQRNANSLREEENHVKDEEAEKIHKRQKEKALSKRKESVAEAWRNYCTNHNYNTPAAAAAAMKLCRCFEDHCVCYF